MRIAVCDDDRKDLDEIVHILSEYGNMDISAFSQSDDLLREIEKETFDLIVLDIEMPGTNGFDAAVQLRSMGKQPLIIFLTNTMDYTLRGYGIAFRYLKKPIDRTLLYQALDAAVREIKANRFSFQMDGSSRVIPMDEICFFEVFNHHTILHTMNETYTFRATLKQILPQLPKGYFGVPHQSYVVNFNHVKIATSTEIFLTNGASIPVSRRRKAEFEHQFHQYLGR